MRIRSPKRGRLIQTIHDVIPITDAYQSEDPRIFFRRLAAISRYSDRVVAVSTYTKNRLLDFFPHLEDRISVAHQPVPISPASLAMSSDSRTQKAVLLKYGLTAGQYFLYVGAIEARKNTHRLISAYNGAGLSNDFPLVIAGGFDREYVVSHKLESIFSSPYRSKDSNFRSTVRYIGYISDVEKLCLLKQARALLFPTINEGYGLPPLEAQSVGCPVLTTNVAAIPELIGDSALLVENPFDIGEIAKGIRTLAEDDEARKAFGERGQRNARRFSSESFSAAISQIISSTA